MSEKTELTMSECMDLLGVSKYRIQQLIQEENLSPCITGIQTGKKAEHAISRC